MPPSPSYSVDWYYDLRSINSGKTVTHLMCECRHQRQTHTESKRVAKISEFNATSHRIPSHRIPSHLLATFIRIRQIITVSFSLSLPTHTLASLQCAPPTRTFRCNPLRIPSVFSIYTISHGRLLSHVSAMVSNPYYRVFCWLVMWGRPHVDMDGRSSGGLCPTTDQHAMCMMMATIRAHDYRTVCV